MDQLTARACLTDRVTMAHPAREGLHGGPPPEAQDTILRRMCCPLTWSVAPQVAHGVWAATQAEACRVTRCYCSVARSCLAAPASRRGARYVLTVLVEGRHLLPLFLTTLVRTDYALPLQLHEGVLRSGGETHEG